ncbi:MAG: N-acetylmuramoyl-L-alanine amidase [Bacteroidales bacterium]|nr:N-acetylmuramoyl-L-alanine amidase [Bacteroidales bacterium]
MMNFKKQIFVYALLLFLFSPLSMVAQEKTFKVVIDAGHGGHDSGCLGSHLKEKDVSLDIALMVGKLISEHCPEVKVIYTRKTDVFVELYRRAQIANSEHADLFISFHCNASEDHIGNGIETWVMGLHKSEANQAVARAENAAMLKEKNYKNNYDGFDPNSPEANVLFSLYSSAYLKNSVMLADKVQKNLINSTHLVNRGVKQAGFWVLYKVAMPSILIEMGFLSNKNDEAFLASTENRKKEAASIYNAFVDYLAAVTNSQPHAHEAVTPATPKPGTVKEDLPKENVPTGTVTPKPETPEKLQAIANEVVPDSNVIRFKVQFLASPEKLPLTDSRFRNLPGVDRFFENNLWKYTAGNETSHTAIREILTEVKRKFPDAFVIGFQNGKKISEQEALRLLKK